MKIIFFGTPDFAAKTLEYLVEKQVQIAAVVTQPDRPKGRSLQMCPSPVKIFAEKKNIKIFQPEKASSPEFLDELMAIKADLFIVVAFGQILSQKLLNIPPLGCINVHASLLPKYRGAAPIQRAIMAGEKETGIAIQKMVKQLDAGDVIIEKRVQISEDMIFDELEHLLVETTKLLLFHVVKEFEKGVPPATPQNHDLATYASKIDFSEEKNGYGVSPNLSTTHRFQSGTRPIL